MISVDNSVELMIKTYLGLPSRITGITGLTRTRFEQISQSFPALLDALEEFAPDKIVGIELGDIEWFHRLRNQLYHQGNGITVEKAKLEGYSEIAKILFFNLFSVSVEDASTPHSLVGEFFSNWAYLERELLRLKKKHTTGDVKRYELPYVMVRQLESAGILPPNYAKQFDGVRQFRNELAHGFATPSINELKKYLVSLTELLKVSQEL